MKKNTTINKITNFLFHNVKTGWTVTALLALFLLMILSGLFSESNTQDTEEQPRTEQTSSSNTAESESITEESDEVSSSKKEKLTPATVHSFASAKKYINDCSYTEIWYQNH